MKDLRYEFEIYKEIESKIKNLPEKTVPTYLTKAIFDRINDNQFPILNRIKIWAIAASILFSFTISLFTSLPQNNSNFNERGSLYTYYEEIINES